MGQKSLEILIERVQRIPTYGIFNLVGEIH
jgi:hypothetical protein